MAAERAIRRRRLPSEGVDRATVGVYEARAAVYAGRRIADEPERAAVFAAAVPEGGVRIDLGCGPGLYLGVLGRPVVGGDAAFPMCALARAAHPGVAVVVHDAEALPFRPGSSAGVWASKCLQHLDADRLPEALAELHRVLPVGGRLEVVLFAPTGEEWVARRVSDGGDDLPGRLFTLWSPAAFTELLEGAGFDVDAVHRDDDRLHVIATRGRTLPDIVGPGLRLLVCGLNPSLYAADHGVAYGRPGNRFWPAALAAGLVSVARDPWHARRHHGVGFTDLVKRASVGAAELTAAEYRAGAERLDRLVGLLRPRAVACCGLTGWRAAVDRRATAGVQPGRLGGRPVYLLPNPSGLNAHVRVADIAAHLAAAAELADRTSLTS